MASLLRRQGAQLVGCYGRASQIALFNSHRGGACGSGFSFTQSTTKLPLFSSVRAQSSLANKLNTTNIVVPLVTTIRGQSPLLLSQQLGGRHEVIQQRSASNNMLVIRRKKMKKHKRRKRYRRDHFKVQKYHQQKKLKAETLFRQRMNDMIDELETFDPLKHVKDTMRRAKREWSVSLVPSGRKKYPNWHEMMSLEELYGLAPDDYIDKKVGRPSDEDQAQIDELRRDYFKRFVRKPPAEAGSKS